MPKVIFLSDPFGRYVEPEVEQAAFDLLAACGYEVYVLPVIGAGASLLSKGFVEAAKRQARKVLEALEQVDPRREAAVVGIEPPDIYCLKNDYFDLLPGRKREIAERVDKVWLLDEFLVRSEAFHDLRIGTKPRVIPRELRASATTEESLPRSGETLQSVQGNGDKPIVLFQPHCHQRAEGLADDGLPSGVSATVELLRSCGYEVDALDTGCCGMAGTFGYEAEHYDLSMQVGELKLFPLLRTPTQPPPSLRDTSPKSDTENLDNNNDIPVVFGGGTVGASGAACRLQIRQGAGVEAVHPIVLARDALLGGPTRKP